MAQFVEQNTKGPHVKRVIVSFVLYHLRSHVLKRAAKSSSLLAVITLNAPSKITYFDDITFLDKDVFWLNVTMDKALFVHIVNTWTHLNKEIECRIFAQILLSSDEVKQVAFAGIFEGQIDCVSIFKGRIKPTDVLVIELLLNSYLTNEGFFNFRWC